jgi:pyridinium-3,5-bisthiocarboxylic acid mononucleotide nickel chelatase
VTPTSTTTMRQVLLDETGTLGVRSSAMRRWPQRRTETAVEVDGHRIRVKLADHRVKVEFDDAAAAAAALGVPVRVVLDRAADLVAETGRTPTDPRAVGSRPVGSIAVSKLAWKLPGGDELFRRRRLPGGQR